MKEVIKNRAKDLPLDITAVEEERRKIRSLEADEEERGKRIKRLKFLASRKEPLFSNGKENKES
jgi:hypothetical protein